MVHLCVRRKSKRWKSKITPNESRNQQPEQLSLLERRLLFRVDRIGNRLLLAGAARTTLQPDKQDAYVRRRNAGNAGSLPQAGRTNPGELLSSFRAQAVHRGIFERIRNPL